MEGSPDGQLSLLKCKQVGAELSHFGHRTACKLQDLTCGATPGRVLGVGVIQCGEKDMSTKQWTMLTLGLISVLTLGAVASSPAATSATTALQKVIACHGVTNDQQRLACYDGAVSELLAGAQGGASPAAADDVMVISKEQARNARRQAFGFDLSALSIFDRGEKPEVIDKISITVLRAYQTGAGRWIIDMDNGSTWEQTDDERVWHGPSKGSKADIRKASMGSSFINLDGQRAIRARRVK